MKYIGSLTDEDFGLKTKKLNNPIERTSARGIIVNNEGKVAILHKKLKNEYKLIGGGMKELEDPIKAFKREALEETGCTIEIDDFMGRYKEEKNQDNFRQISYLYVAHVLKQKQKPEFTKKEIEEGSEILWIDFDEAIELIKNCENNLIESKFSNVYQTRFAVRRDYNILKYYQKHYLQGNM